MSKPDNGKGERPAAVLSLDELTQLRKRSECIIELARKKAGEILEKAKQESSAIREEAYNHGYQAGFQEGEAKGRIEGLKQIQHKGESLIKEMDKINAQYESEINKLLKAIEPKVIQLITEQMNKVLHRSLEEDKDLVLRNIVAAGEKLSARDSARLYVHKNDLAKVLSKKDEIMRELDSVTDLEIIAGKEVDPGGCLIETSSNLVDGKIKSQMEEISEIYQPS